MDDLNFKIVTLIGAAHFSKYNKTPEELQQSS